MTRRCSHCSHNGHNSRTCPNRGVKLFGVRLTYGSIRKSASMGNLSHYAGSAGGASPADVHDPGGDAADGYASENFVQGSSSSCRERKTDPQFFPMNSQASDTQGNNPLPAPSALDEECESMDSNNSVHGEAAAPKSEALQCSYPVTVQGLEKHTHEVVKPTPAHSKAPINVDELLGMSRLSIGDSVVDTAPSSLTLNLLGGSDRLCLEAQIDYLLSMPIHPQVAQA